MALPFFYLSVYDGGSLIDLDEPTSRHIVSVLRMQIGEQLHLTDGKGLLLTATVTDAHKKKTVVKVENQSFFERQTAIVSIAISLVKNNARFEWFLEKATETGVANIYPIICQRTEKQNFRYDRMHQILVSAMLQSQQVWLPELSEPVPFNTIVKGIDHNKKWIAHCIETNKESLRKQGPAKEKEILLIGPEGDFTEAEIALALAHGFAPVSLGETRLRTETAGMVGATLLLVN